MSAPRRKTTLLGIAMICDWTAPGSDPYYGTIEQAVAHFQLPKNVQQEFVRLIKAHKYVDQVAIRANDIVSVTGSPLIYRNLRNMHFGPVVCPGPVIRKWTNGQSQHALVYRVQNYTLLYPAVCRNLAQVDVEDPTLRGFETLSLDEIKDGALPIENTGLVLETDNVLSIDEDLPLDIGRPRRPVFYQDYSRIGVWIQGTPLVSAIPEPSIWKLWIAGIIAGALLLSLTSKP